MIRDIIDKNYASAGIEINLFIWYSSSS